MLQIHETKQKCTWPIGHQSEWWTNLVGSVSTYTGCLNFIGPWHVSAAGSSGSVGKRSWCVYVCVCVVWGGGLSWADVLFAMLEGAVFVRRRTNAEQHEMQRLPAYICTWPNYKVAYYHYMMYCAPAKQNRGITLLRQICSISHGKLAVAHFNTKHIKCVLLTDVL